MRYNTKKKIKKGMIYFIIFLIGFSIFSFYVDIPQLNPIKLKIINLTNSYLSTEEVGRTDNLEITIKDVKLSDSNGKFENGKPLLAPNGAKYLFIFIEVTNIGKVRTSEHTVQAYRDPFGKLGMSWSAPKLYYAENEMPNLLYVSEYEPDWRGYGAQYPGVTKEGWIGFEVPAEIELNETILEIHGLKWKLSK